MITKQCPCGADFDATDGRQRRCPTCREAKAAIVPGSVKACTKCGKLERITRIHRWCMACRTQQARVKELLDFEHESGVPLPLFLWRIIELEDQGLVVDLETGAVYSAVTAQPTQSAVAVLHLLAHEQGSIVI